MTEIATLAGGCFWCLEAIFKQIRGVHRVQSGYIGGHVTQPQYQQVCEGNTGHAEAVEIEFDPTLISYADLLQVFFAIHDPTTRNRQGNDIGPQYRSAIFFHSDSQRQQAQTAITDAEIEWARAIVTELNTATPFWPAELEHADYYNLHPEQPYCRAVVGPKVQKFMRHFEHLLQPQT